MFIDTYHVPSTTWMLEILVNKMKPLLLRRLRSSGRDRQTVLEIKKYHDVVSVLHFESAAEQGAERDRGAVLGPAAEDGGREAAGEPATQSPVSRRQDVGFSPV